LSGGLAGPPRRSGSSPGRPHGAHRPDLWPSAVSTTRDSCATRSIAAAGSLTPARWYRSARLSQPCRNHPALADP